MREKGCRHLPVKLEPSRKKVGSCSSALQPGLGFALAPGTLPCESRLRSAENQRPEFQGEVLDVAANTNGDNDQIRLGLERIQSDNRIAAIYAFSGGGYNARLIWQQLDRAERERIRKVVVIGSPGIHKADFADAAEVLITPDPPEGHMAGPKVLLDSLGLQTEGARN
jgi:hypothetical protein